MNDPYNAIARAIVWMSLIENLGHNVDNRLHFNTDKSSHYLNAATNTTLLAAIGVKTELADRHRNVTATKSGKEEKNRGFAYTPITNAAGETLAWTTHITDHTFNSDGCVKTYRLDDRRYLQTIPTGPKPIAQAGSGTDVADTCTIGEMQEAEGEITGSDVTHDTVAIIVEKSAEEIVEEQLALELMNKFAAQEAEQYINVIYIPVMLQRRKKAMLEDYYTDHFATVPLTASSATLPNMGYMDEASLEMEANIQELAQTSRYRILGTIDGERNGNNTLKRLYKEQPVVTVSQSSASESAATSTSSEASVLPLPISEHNSSDPGPQTDNQDPSDIDRDLSVCPSKTASLNMDFMKHGASCSKIEQIQDVIRGGFMTMHQFFNGPMFKKFNMEVLGQPYTIVIINLFKFDVT